MTETVPTRIQLALNVEDIDAAVAFYSALFGTEPAKRRPGYANFAVATPPLKLVLLENKGAAERLNHLGVELAHGRDVDAAQTRLGGRRPRVGRRARHDLLLRQAGQVLGRGIPRRRALGDLHRARRQPDVLRRDRPRGRRGGRHLLRRDPRTAGVHGLTVRRTACC